MKVFSITYFFFRVLFFPNNKFEKIACRSIWENVNFRLPKSAEKDLWLGLRQYKAGWRAFFNKTPPLQIIDRKGNFLILDANISFYKDDKEYYNRLGYKPFGYVSKSDLSGFGFSLFSFSVFMATIGIFFVIFSTIKKKHKANIGLLITFLLEQIGLFTLVKEHNIKIIHDHVQYENDSNFSYLLFKKQNVKYHKCPSPGPLKIHNQLILVDSLFINNPYQEEELNIYSETIRFKNYKKVPPENAFKFIDFYRDKNHSLKNSLGFYSHGAWVRKKQGHKNDGLTILQSENEILNILTNLRVEKGYFLHPKEKLDIKEAISFYHKFDNAPTFLNLQSPSNLLFASVDIGLGAYSTILFERLFAGFKTLFYRSEKDDFPRKDSALFQISFSNSIELQSLISTISGMTNKEFFSNYKLDGYAWWSFDLGLGKQ